MEWSEVFDKYFIIHSVEDDKVLVFIPGSLTEKDIRWCWTTVEEIERGVDVTTKVSNNYSFYGTERDSPGSTFNNWKPMVKPSQEEMVCKKIKVMEERWKKFQEQKAEKKKIKTVRPKVKKDYVGTFIGYDWAV